MKVRVDSLRRGQRFRCVSGFEWVYDRKDGALSGVHWADRATGGRDCFCGSALVQPLELDSPQVDPLETPVVIGPERLRGRSGGWGRGFTL